MSGAQFTRRQLLLLVFVTVFWGLNWPVLKLGVSGYPPLSFRALSMALGLPMLLAICLWMKMPLRVARADWRELGLLTFTNMVVWHTLAILAIQSLSSGRAAILGYTMPIFSAVWGMLWFSQRLSGRQGVGVGAAAFGVALLLWHEIDRLTGSPAGVAGMLGAAAVWAFGTQLLRRTRIAAPTLVLVWWMSVLTTIVMASLAWTFERQAWTPLPPAVWAAVAYNAVLIFGMAQPAWLLLARDLPPAASTLSVMLIPVLGTASGAWFLNESLHWQDGAALALIGIAIVSVLWAPRRPPDDQPAR
ncbi:DMT family transporter [Piscinibacter sakaiensis]|uniref:DMT family transporter n=1 Tax=Piscinibacter sakaiensis TaxID=1547922 RepID=UPI003AAB124D